MKFIYLIIGHGIMDMELAARVKEPPEVISWDTETINCLWVVLGKVEKVVKHMIDQLVNSGDSFTPLIWSVFIIILNQCMRRYLSN